MKMMAIGILEFEFLFYFCMEKYELFEMCKTFIVHTDR